MSTEANERYVLDGERSVLDQPQMVLDAIAERDSIIADGGVAPQFDENGMEVTDDGSR